MILTGNHDITLDADFYAKHGHEFHNKQLQSHEECLALLRNSPSLTYLQHETATIRLSSPTGPRTTFTVFGSPRAPAFGNWAFYYPAYDEEMISKESMVPEKEAIPTPSLTSTWDTIPPRVDVVVTHTPPRGHCDDRAGITRPTGCEALRRALWRVRPRLAVCGHIHDGRGVSRVSWDLDRPYGERMDDAGPPPPWQDPGAGSGNRISLVDLTGKKGGLPLANDGLWHDPQQDSSSSTTAGCSAGQVCDGCAMSASKDGDVRAPGWHGRKETCVVNAAIMKSNFPHIGGKQFYKPIVVDLELPVAEEEE